MTRQILVPVDGSRKSLEGLEYAVTTFPRDEITVLSVVNPAGAVAEEGRPLTQEQFEEWRVEARDEANEILAEARELADEHGCDVTTVTDVGEPWRAIVDYAERQDVDHVVMGSHGRSRDSNLPLGSVAETVVRRSPVHVSIIR